MPNSSKYLEAMCLSLDFPFCSIDISYSLSFRSLFFFIQTFPAVLNFTFRCELLSQSVKNILLVFLWGFNHCKHSYCIISSILFCFPIIYGELISLCLGLPTVLSWWIFFSFGLQLFVVSLSLVGIFFFPLERVQCTLGCKNVAIKQLCICFCWVWGDENF